MAAETAAGSPVSTTSNSTTSPRERKRYARLPPLYKALIWTSFLINAVLIVVVGVVLGLLWNSQRQLQALAGNGTVFAASNLAELQDVVAKLETATIQTSIPLDQALNLAGKNVIVPVDQQTTVTLVDPVPLTLSGADIDLGNGNRLRANNINLTLPQGTPLKIYLRMDIPLDQVQIPVQLDVPVNIPLAQTELGPQFRRLGAIVDRLVTPIQPILPWPEQAPDSSQAAPPDAALPRNEPAVPEPQPATP
jgi:hypothetical protein